MTMAGLSAGLSFGVSASTGTAASNTRLAIAIRMPRQYDNSDEARHRRPLHVVRHAVLRPGPAVRLLRDHDAARATGGTLVTRRDRVHVSALDSVGAEVSVGAVRRQVLLTAHWSAPHVDPVDAGRGHADP